MLSASSKTCVRWKTQALMWDKKAFPRSCPSRPALPPAFRKAGVLLAGLWSWQRKSSLSSGPGSALIRVRSAEGVFSAEAWMSDSAYIEGGRFPNIWQSNISTFQGGSKSSSDWGGLITSAPALGHPALVGDGWSQRQWQAGPTSSGRLGGRRRESALSTQLHVWRQWPFSEFYCCD